LDVAYPILWLASDEAAAITGTTLTVDGGFTVKGIASIAAGSDPAMAATMAEPL
jgi:NAD(P)-dependent dehydrogenase (short-subunit alcohol dehydrogenase family)